MSFIRIGGMVCITIGDAFTSTSLKPFAERPVVVWVVDGGVDRLKEIGAEFFVRKILLDFVAHDSCCRHDVCIV